jgi:cytochrome c2
VADSPAPGESLVKKEPELPAEDPIASRSSSGWMLVSALLMTISIAWALYDEAFGQRPWKGMQQEFVARYGRYLDNIKANAGKSESEIKEGPEYTQLDDELKAVEAQAKPEIDQIAGEVRNVQRKLDAVTEPFQNQRGHLTVINYYIETAKDSAKDRYRRQAEVKRQETVEVDLPTDDGSAVETRSYKYAELEALYDGLRDEKAKKLARIAELAKPASDVRKTRDDYLKNQLIGLGPAAIEGLRNGLANYDYSILGHQISVIEYDIVDRCEVCHAGIRQPLELTAASLAPQPGGEPDRLARAFVSHPNREILQVHKPEKFGCASCHWGNGRATTSETKGHGRHRFWLWPMFEKENTEAGCQQCHARDRVTDGATTLNLGRDLFSERGCTGCHRYEGFDRETDALAGARQQTGQLQDQILANEKEIRAVTAKSGEVESNEEAQRLLAQADALRVTNSLLSARMDQLNLQTKYLMQDQKKVGPNLKDVRVKLRKEWVPYWLENPQVFRPGTKMPTFWRFAAPIEGARVNMRDKDGAEQIQAIAAYLWQDSFDVKLPEQQRGDAAHGKQLFETRGCLACHSIGEGESKLGGDFAANLHRVGEKSNFDYIVRWIHNPRERVAPYCPHPDHKRDLTPADYAQKGLRFEFDTELHSRCPIDGTELQVQNMTVMPNFRLSEQDSRDIATYLFSLSSPPSYASAAFMDDANLKEKGRALIKQYGCAGCHEIQGFEDEQRIGKELTVEGATPIERLDFALQTHHAEDGEDPLNLRPDQEHKSWYNHKGFFERKIKEPSIYDEGKEKDPKDKLRMPQPYLTDEWRVALTTFLLGSVGNEGANVPSTLFYTPQDQRRQDIQNGWWVIKKYNCQGCHQLQVGQRSAVQELPFYQTPEGKDLLPPRLTSEGARVDPGWLLKFLHDPSLSGEKTPEQARQISTLTPANSQSGPQASASPAAGGSASPSATPAANQAAKLPPQPGLDRNGVRPYLTFRMPTFNFSPNELQVLVRFFMAMSGQQDPYIKEPMLPLTAQERLTARQMFVSGTPCLKCHITGDPAHDATAIAPNFLLASERLKPDWTFRWLLDPAQISPGTAMPTGLFRKEGERWVVNLPNPPPSASAYHDDHARLMVRYMFLLSPDEQRQLLAAERSGPPAAATPAVQNHARAKRRRTGFHHRRKPVHAGVGRSAARALYNQ